MVFQVGFLVNELLCGLVYNKSELVTICRHYVVGIIRFFHFVVFIIAYHIITYRHHHLQYIHVASLYLYLHMRVDMYMYVVKRLLTPATTSIDHFDVLATGINSRPPTHVYCRPPCQPAISSHSLSPSHTHTHTQAHSLTAMYITYVYTCIGSSTQSSIDPCVLLLAEHRSSSVCMWESSVVIKHTLCRCSVGTYVFSHCSLYCRTATFAAYNTPII